MPNIYEKSGATLENLKEASKFLTKQAFWKKWQYHKTCFRLFGWSNQVIGLSTKNSKAVEQVAHIDASELLDYLLEHNTGTEKWNRYSAIFAKTQYDEHEDVLAQKWFDHECH